MPETIQAYLETVQEQIRWKRARPILIQELERHLEDQRDDFLKEGKSPEEAERLAIEDMGDPVTVGAELDAVHRPKPQWGLLGLTIALALVGAVLRVVFLQDHYAPNYLGKAILKSLASLGLGTAAMLGMYFLDVSRLARHAKALYIAALAAGALSLWLSPTRTASHYSYYTSYVVLLYPLAYALWLYSFRRKGWRGLVLSILGGVPLAAICCLTPTMMWLTTLLLSGLILTLCAVQQDWFGTGRAKGVGAVLAVPACVIGYLLSQGYLHSFRQRLEIALHPEQWKESTGFMGGMMRMFWEDVPPLRFDGPSGASISAGSRIRFYGNGPELLPVDFSHDFLPATMARTWGWVPFVLLLAALAVLLVWLLVKGLRQKYLLGRFVVLAVTLTLGFQALFSMALNFGFLIFFASLPLVVGNLQTVIDMALIGLALSVFRGEAAGRDEPALPLRRIRRIRLRIEYQ